MALDCYKILGVLKAATAGEIRKAYHKGALKWHPDKNPDHKDEAERRFRHLSEAYEVLKDPLKRAEYDRLAAAKEEVLKPKVPPPPPPGAAARATSRGAADARKATGGADTGGTGDWDWGWGTGSATYAGSARPGAAWATDAGGAGARAAKSARRPATGARTLTTVKHSPRSTDESERNKYCYRYRANGKAKAKAGDSHYRSTDNYYRHRSPDTARAGHYNYDNGAQTDNPFRSSSHCSPDSARVGDNHYDNGAQTDNPFRSGAHRSPNSARTGDNLYGWGARADNQYRSSSHRRSPDSARAGDGAFRYRYSPRAGDNHYRDDGRADHHYRYGTSNFDDYCDNGSGNGDNLHRKRCQGCRLRRQWCPDW